MKPVTRKPPFYTKLSLVLLSLVLIVLILQVTKEVLAPVAFAFLFSLLLLPLAQLMERIRFSRGAAAGIAVFFFVLSMAGILYFVSMQMAGFLADIPLLEQRLLAEADVLTDWIDHRFNISSANQMAYLNDIADRSISGGAQMLINTFSSVSATVLFLVFIPIYTFFLLYYRRLLVSFLVKLFRREHATDVYDAIDETRKVVKGYVVGLFIEMIVVAALNCTVLALIGVKYAVLLGTIGALLNVIPYIGFIVTMIFTIIITFTTNTGIMAVWAALALFAIHLLDSNVLLPRIVGSKVKINALVTILGVFIGNMVWGVSGMFISIPALALLKIIFDRMPNMRAWAILLGTDEK
ncbi:AI-2E family transporter [uncultured Chitinophaga sp.]|uniref:AI-2E family transporter n=1 Tax=uncultured Chitinophaga sp. TaxID=339340 RepID=UPI0025F901CC|nr:AI-2E family transporter [uncultured Chitinophaga sp.]